MPRRLDFGGDAAPTPTQTTMPPSAPVAPPAPTMAPPVAPTIMPPVAAPSPPVLSKATPVVATAEIKMPITLEEIGRVGGEAQTQLAAVTSKITGVAKTSDMDEMGKLLSNTIMAAKGYDPSNLFKGGLFGFLKAKSKEIQLRFDTVDKTVQRLVGEVDTRISHFRARVTDLDQLGVANRGYHDSLTPQIDYMIQTADWMDANTPVPIPDDQMSALAVQNWITVANFARKRGDDLRRAQILAQQQAAQIDQMKVNSTALAQKFGDIKVTTIPAMQNTFTLYVINMEQKKGAEFADTVDNLTNDAIQKNAVLLGQNTQAIHSSLNRANISMESLQANYNSIIKSLETVEAERLKMRERIKTEGPQLEKLSQDLTARLAQKTALS